MFRSTPSPSGRLCQLLPWLATVTSLIAFTPLATAADFRVNISADIADADPGDGRCDVDAGRAGDQCSLRAAAEQISALPAGSHRILVDALPLNASLQVERGTIRLPSGTTLQGNPDRLTALSAFLADGEDLFRIDGDASVAGLDIRLSGTAGAAVRADRAGQTIQLADLRVVPGSADAAALRVQRGRLDCRRCRFIDGSTTAVNVSGGELRLIDSLIADNRSEAAGGGLRISGGRVWLQRSEVSRNRSQAEGGGIRQAGGELRLINSLLRGNLAARGGGGLAIDSGVAELQNSSVVGNVANADARGEQSGGGLLSTGDGRIHLRNSIVSSNRVLAMHAGNECAGSGIVSEATNVIGPDPGCQLQSAERTSVLRSEMPMTTAMRPLPWGGLRMLAMPSPGHPAVGAGASGCLADVDLDADTPDQPLQTDLRQQPRPAISDMRRCDLGAIQSRCDANCTDTVVQTAPSDAAVTTSSLLFPAQTATPRSAPASYAPDTSRP